MSLVQCVRGTGMLCLFLLFLVTLPASSLQAASAKPQRAGGPCAYTDYPGKATIIEVTPIPRKKNAQAGLPYQAYRALFTFEPSKPIPGELVTPGKAYELTLSGGTPPGPEFLKKYGIRPGASFRTDLHVLSSGTCSPVVFTFHGIDVFDFFELKSR